jgi:hypothetical protein
MPADHLYHTWIAQIRELQADKRITQIRNFVWLLVGIYKSRSVHLSKVAGKIPGQAKLLTHLTQKFLFRHQPLNPGQLLCRLYKHTGVTIGLILLLHSESKP